MYLSSSAWPLIKAKLVVEAALGARWCSGCCQGGHAAGTDIKVMTLRLLVYPQGNDNRPF